MKKSPRVKRETNTTAKKDKQAKGSFGVKLKAKALATYYGNPIKDMKLICVTGSTGKTKVARFVYEILKAAGEQVEILASDGALKIGELHKFFSEAWKAGANYVVVTTPAESLQQDVFYGLPVYIAAITDFVPSTLSDMTADDFKASTATLFDMDPEIVILNHDDIHYQDFASFAGQKATLTYGQDRFSAVQIESSKLYRLGSEASLNLSGTRFTVASFLTGETAVSYMACATAIATALHISTDYIVEGLANFEPDENIAEQK
ncbi:hypothetical protein IJ096_02535 [Candidatus Saccharibacteria bacterium]|nr:hypothetical protein [Candidatus Saccharibacteria bacterium]